VKKKCKDSCSSSGSPDSHPLQERTSIRVWARAQTRAVVTKVPDSTALEQQRFLQQLIGTIEGKHDDSFHRISLMTYARDASAPTRAYVEQVQTLIEDELRIVKANVLVAIVWAKGLVHLMRTSASTAWESLIPRARKKERLCQLPHLQKGIPQEIPKGKQSAATAERREPAGNRVYKHVASTRRST